MKRFLLLPHGSSGDVYPFIWLGRLLRERGHQVTLIAPRVFAASVLAAGVDFMPLPHDEHEEMCAHPDLYHPAKGMFVAYGFAGRATGAYADAIEAWITLHGRPDLLLAPVIAFGAWLIHLKLKIPLVTVQLHPMSLMSAHEVPLLSPLVRWLRLLPMIVRKAILSLPSPFDLTALLPIWKACLRHQVRPPLSPWLQWYHSANGVLALFPSWYARPQPDWPKNMLQWDFPLEDLAQENTLPADLVTFLEGGDKPVVFTAGTANQFAQGFFKTAAELAARLHIRAVFVTLYPAQIPAGMSSSIRVVSYAAFGSLLAHAAAFVHHGGIGTLAQGLAAGLPQLIVSMCHDQPDNGERIERLGVGLTLGMKDFTADRAEPLLRRLLEDPAMRQRAAELAALARQRAAPDTLMEWLEHKCALQVSKPASISTIS